MALNPAPFHRYLSSGLTRCWLAVIYSILPPAPMRQFSVGFNDFHMLTPIYRLLEVPELADKMNAEDDINLTYHQAKGKV